MAYNQRTSNHGKRRVKGPSSKLSVNSKTTFQKADNRVFLGRLVIVSCITFGEQEELVRCLSQTNHDVLPALLEPSSVLEHNAQIYSQVGEGSGG